MTHLQACNEYLQSRTGRYEWRAIRYRAAALAMVNNGLSDEDTVFDIGAGMTEMDYLLRTEFDWRGRYVPIDGSIDGINLETWVPPRQAEWFVALEILEHLHEYRRLTNQMMTHATKGVIFSTPNPETTDVLGMDETHVVEVDRTLMSMLGFEVSEQMFYGGAFSDGRPDSLFGVWLR